MAEALTPYISLYHLIGQGKISAERIIEVLDAPVLPVLAPPQTPQDAGVCFEHVSFRYLGRSKNALTDISFTAPAGSLTALVGGSGCGKTTLIRLIMRYADPQQGRILIGGSDIRALTQEDLMRQISVVFQDVYLFDDTIANNIRLGKADASDAEIEAAARTARCHDFIMAMPEGYQTRVGDIGGKLSGGEKQRISIARALLKNAPIIILDEPTAALDTESEVAVQQAIDALVQDKTVIVITHRLSTISGAQQIIVLSGGQVAESGTHSELLTQNGVYRRLWQAGG
ncbi:ABC transporter ATP-binding protein [Kingella oralis]|uniref:ABC transporter ATP-binding protein n=1 Tax=Kingella oralis TaxID=505 RepID=UPI0034E54A52